MSCAPLHTAGWVPAITAPSQVRTTSRVRLTDSLDTAHLAPPAKKGSTTVLDRRGILNPRNPAGLIQALEGSMPSLQALLPLPLGLTSSTCVLSLLSLPSLCIHFKLLFFFSCSYLDTTPQGSLGTGDSLIAFISGTLVTQEIPEESTEEITVLSPCSSVREHTRGGEESLRPAQTSVLWQKSFHDKVIAVSKFINCCLFVYLIISDHIQKAQRHLQQTSNPQIGSGSRFHKHPTRT